GRPKEAVTAYGEALALFRPLAVDFPDQPDLRHFAARTCNNLAFVRLGQRDFEAAKAALDEAGPHLKAALKANPRHPEYRLCRQNNLRALIGTNAGLGDQAAAR